MLRMETSWPPTLSLAAGKQWHLFLSHSWANQDVVATIKHRLELMLPRVQCFLDVDNLNSLDDLEREVALSQAVLTLLGSTKYLSSPNCRREVAEALRRHLPLVRVHEADPSKGGSPLKVLRDECEKRTPDHTKYLFCAQETKAPIPWHRLPYFQQKAVAAIAERMLLSSPAYNGRPAITLHVGDGLAWSQLSFRQPIKLYVSEDNPPAAEVKEALVEKFGDDVELVPSLQAATHWLLFLSPSSFRDEKGERLVKEVATALRERRAPILLWSHNEDEADFDEIVNATPKELREAGLYNPLAIEWHSEPDIHFPVSLRLVARELGAQATGGGVRECMARASRACVACVYMAAKELVSIGQACDARAGSDGAGLLKSRSGLVVVRPSARSKSGSMSCRSVLRANGSSLDTELVEDVGGGEQPPLV